MARTNQEKLPEQRKTGKGKRKKVKMNVSEGNIKERGREKGRKVEEVKQLKCCCSYLNQSVSNTSFETKIKNYTFIIS